MARVAGWTDGAEFGDTLYWDSVTAGVSASTVQKRTGNYSYLFTSGGKTATKNISTPLSTLYHRFAIYPDTIPGTNYNFVSYRNSTTPHIYLRLTGSTGIISVYHGGGTLLGNTSASISLKSWVLLEVYLVVGDSPNGAVTIKADGETIATITGVDTKNGASTTVDNVYFEAGPSVQFYLDDLGLDNSEWCNDGRIELLTVNGAGDSTQWIPSGEVSPDPLINYQMVDDVPPDGDTSYNSTASSGNTDLYSHSTFDPTGKTVRMLIAEGRLRGEAGGEIVKLDIKRDGTVYKSSEITLTTAFKRFTSEYITDPSTSSAWNSSGIADTQVGAESV